MGLTGNSIGPVGRRALQESRFLRDCEIRLYSDDPLNGD
jgi:hypothetical protein